VEEADGAFSVRETHGILWRPENRVRAASEGLGWTSLYASAQRETPYEASYAAVRDHLVVLHLDGPVGVGRVLGRTRERRVVAPGGSRSCRASATGTRWSSSSRSASATP
jgi:AraC family transcriptional regulator